jgi:hypothetical protein
VTAEASPARPGSPVAVGRVLGVAAFGGTLSFAVLVVSCQVLALVQYLLLGGFGLWSWAKIGLLTALLSVRADVIATVHGSPGFRSATRPETLQLRVVPMLLTIGSVWLAARAGRRAARAMPGRSPFIASALAAAGAGVPVALLAEISAGLVTLSFPAIGLRLRIDASSAALWAGVLAAAGAGTGAYLEAAAHRPFAAALRGGLTAYGWALGLLTVGVFVLATLEPTVTRAYVDEVAGLGAPGGALVGFHLLALPAQSALVLAPASGSCIEIAGEGPMFDLCPWRLIPSGPAGRMLLPAPLSLSPWLWLMSGVPAVAAMLGGRRAVTGATLGGRGALGLGIAAGSVFAALAILGAWLASPLLSPIVLPLQISAHPGWLRTGIMALLWGAGGGALGAWLAATGSPSFRDRPRRSSTR